MSPLNFTVGRRVGDQGNYKILICGGEIAPGLSHMFPYSLKQL